MDLLKKYYLIIIILALIGLNIFLWYMVWCQRPGKLVVAILNIGQGDGIYIEAPNHNQLLIDGGPPRTILGELPHVMHFFDRSINMILVTNPDQDHIGGFIDVLGQYKVDQIVEPGTHSPTATYKALEDSVATHHLSNVMARRGMVIHLGGGADLHILFPDQDVSTWATNDGSIIAKLTYGTTSVIFTGDAPSKTEEYTATLDPSIMKSDLLKVGHHGSKYSASGPFALDIAPRYALISAGLHNKYGHPHKETLDLYKKLNIPVLGTYAMGRIIFESDGNAFTLKK